MRYEAGPFAGIRFFRAVGEGLLVQSGRFLGLPGLLAQSGEGGRIAGANHRAGGVTFRTAGSFLRSRGRGGLLGRIIALSECLFVPLERRLLAPGRKRLFCFDIAADARQTASGQGRCAHAGFELSFVQRHPRCGIHRQRVEDGIERPIGVHRRLLVVGTAALAAVAAENPAVEVDSSGRLPFDGVARDAATRVDHLRGDDGARGTALDAVAAAAAAGPFERGVVGVGFVVQEQLAQQDIGAVAGRDEQRLAAYPAQSGLYGELFFEQRGRIDERPGGPYRRPPARRVRDRRL